MLEASTVRLGEVGELDTALKRMRGDTAEQIMSLVRFLKADLNRRAR